MYVSVSISVGANTNVLCQEREECGGARGVSARRRRARGARGARRGAGARAPAAAWGWCPPPAPRPAPPPPAAARAPLSHAPTLQQQIYRLAPSCKQSFGALCGKQVKAE